MCVWEREREGECVCVRACVLACVCGGACERAYVFKRVCVTDCECAHARAQGNGYWSLIRVVHCCLDKLLQKVRRRRRRRRSGARARGAQAIIEIINRLPPGDYWREII